MLYMYSSDIFHKTNVRYRLYFDLWPAPSTVCPVALNLEMNKKRRKFSQIWLLGPCFYINMLVQHPLLTPSLQNSCWPGSKVKLRISASHSEGLCYKKSSTRHSKCSLFVKSWCDLKKNPEENTNMLKCILKYNK